MKTILISFILLLTVGCAGHMKRANVVMKIGKNKAHVSLGEKQVKINDNILFYENVCTYYDNEVEGLDGLCNLVLRGSGKVTKILGQHYSLVETAGDFEFKEGDLIELKK